MAGPNNDPIWNFIRDLRERKSPGAPEKATGELMQMMETQAQRETVGLEMAKRHTTQGLHFDNGEHETSTALMDIYAQKLREIIQRENINIETHPILGALAKLDGKKDAQGKDELSDAELGAGLMAIDALSGVNDRGGDLVMGMNFTVREWEYQLAADPKNQKAFLAAAGQFLKDNYGVELSKDLGIPTENDEFRKFMRKHADGLQTDLNKKAYAVRNPGK